jgi:cell division septal protein FtsQ
MSEPTGEQKREPKNEQEPSEATPEATETSPPLPPRRPWWRGRIAIGAGSVVLVALAVLAVLRSPLFAADVITVRGSDRLTEQRVLRIAGIAEVQNVVTFDAGEARRLLEADPWVASAIVTKDLPHTIVVTITEREPVGAIETHLGWEVLAADGVILATPADEPRLPTITATIPGDDVATLGAQLLGAMDPELRSKVDGLTVGVDGIVRLVLRGGVTVDYGGADEAVEKAQALAAVLAWADEEHAHVQVIDVSVPGAPTARLAGGAIATP